MLAVEDRELWEALSGQKVVEARAFRERSRLHFAARHH